MRIPRELRDMILDSRIPDGVLRLMEVMIAVKYGEAGKTWTQAQMAKALGICERELRRRLAWIRSHSEVHAEGAKPDKNVLSPISTNSRRFRTRPSPKGWATSGGSYERGLVYRRGRFLPVRLPPDEAAAELEELRRTQWPSIPWTEETLEAWRRQWDNPNYSLPLSEQKARLKAYAQGCSLTRHKSHSANQT